MPWIPGGRFSAVLLALGGGLVLFVPAAGAGCRIGVAPFRGVVLAVPVAGQRVSERGASAELPPLNAPGASAWNSAAKTPASSSHLA
jgi:hypothetical protein